MAFRKFGSYLKPIARIQSIVGLGADSIAELEAGRLDPFSPLNSTDIGKLTKIGDSYYTLSAVNPDVQVVPFLGVGVIEHEQPVGPSLPFILDNSGYPSLIIYTVLDAAGRVVLPAAPFNGQQITVKDGTGNASGPTDIEVNAAINGLTIEGLGLISIATAFGELSLEFSSTTGEWWIRNTLP
jgi:hypothetical protein